MIELKNIDKYYNIGTVNEICLFKDFNLKIQNGAATDQGRHQC